MKLFVRLLLLCGLTLTLFTVTTAQEDPQTFVPGPELLDDIAGLEAYASGVRGLNLTQEIIRLFPTREEVQSFITSQVSGEEVEEEFRLAQHFYVAFGYLPADLDLLTLYREFLASQIGGYYDPETRAMNTILLTGGIPEDELPATEQIIYVHEFTHALQDANFDLKALIEQLETELSNDPDRIQAIVSLYEGDATAIMNEFTIVLAQDDPIGVLLELLATGAATGTLTIPENIPRIIERELLSPYLDGSNFVEALVDAGGWALVNQAYTDLPESTEQILHPEKYINGESPIEVVLQPLEEGTLSEEWELVFDRTMGEFFLREFLRQDLGVINTDLAASGWGGDRYLLYHNAQQNTHAWVMRLVWDTAGDTSEFSKYFTLFGDARFDGTQDENGCWIGEDTVMCVIEEPLDSHLIASAPTIEQAVALLDSQTAVVTP